MCLLEEALELELQALKQEGVRLHFIGSRESLPASLQELMSR